MNAPRAVFLANDDSFFVSHRLDLGVALRDHGFDVVVAAGEGGGAHTIDAHGLRRQRIPFDRGGRSFARDARTLGAIARLYARERPHLVHHVTIKPVLYGSIVARALRIPVVVNAVSGLGFVFLDRSPRGAALRAAIESTYRVALAHPRSVTIFQNADDRDHFLRVGAVEPKRVRLVRGSGVDPMRFAQRAIPVSRALVLLPARLLGDKGVREFVEAARVLRARGSDARFVLAGAAGGTNPAAIAADEVERWAREGVVEWWGHCDDMPEVYAQAHLVVLPSYREGLPLALLEAASVGRACITTDVPGCRDAVRAGETGWLVPPRDAISLARAIEIALGDATELARRGAAAARFAREGFTREAVVEQHLAIYRELLGEAWPRRQSITGRRRPRPGGGLGRGPRVCE